PAFLRGLGVTALVAGVALAYPLYMQFAGPQRYHGIGFNQNVHSEDLASYAAIPYLSVGRLVGPWGKLAPNLSEETTFWGPAAPRDAVPHFFSSGTWRQYVHSGQTLVPVPPASDLLPDGQRWQAATNFGFAIPHGFFLGPGPDGRSNIGPAFPRPTDELLTNTALYDWNPVITEADITFAQEDLAYWHAKVIVLSDGGQGSRWTARHDALLRAAT